MNRRGIIQLVLGLVIGGAAIALVVSQRGAIAPPYIEGAAGRGLQPLLQSSAAFTSNTFTQYYQPLPQIQNAAVPTEGFVSAARNEHLELYVNPRSLAINVVNVNTGYVFSSTLYNMEEQQLNNTWRNFVDSAITIDFLNQQGNAGRESITLNSSAVELTLVDNGFIGGITFGDSGIGLELMVLLDGRDVVAHVLQSSITEPEGVYLLALQLYPFFGAVREGDVPGYMFIPDGAGALIRYGQSPIQMNSPWRAPIYGNNLGVGQGAAIQANPAHAASMPVFGKVHGQDAFLAIIEGGDNYAELFAYTAGLITEFNWVSVQFNYRFGYFMPTTVREGGPNIHRFQEMANDFDIALRFVMLDGDNANHVGMALAYQQFLLERGMLSGLEVHAPLMRLEFLGGEVAPGLVLQSYLAMTPITDIASHAERLQAMGVADVMAVYRSFARGGSSALPTRFPLARQLGNADDVRGAIQTLAAMGIPLFFNADYSRAFVSGGFFGRGDLAVGANMRPITEGTYFYLTPQVALQQAERDARHIQSLGITNIAIETTATVTNSVFNDGMTSSRQEGQGILSDIIEAILPTGGSLALYRPNAYAWQHTRYYFDIPMSSSRHMFVTDSVPFMQIVLRGHVNYYAPFSNFSGGLRRDMLTAIDLGAYPSFLLTSLPAHLLYDTASSFIHSSEFDVWLDTIVEFYEGIRASLGYVRGAGITARRMLAPGVAKTSYTNGISIIVNYTSEAFEHEGLTVEPEGFTLVQGE